MMKKKSESRTEEKGKKGNGEWVKGKLEINTGERRVKREHERGKETKI